MQTLPPLSKISINSIIRTPSPSPNPHRLTFTVHSATHRFDSPNTTVASTNNVVTSGAVAANRTDWQSSCAILASKVLLHQQNNEKTDDVDIMTVVDERKDVDPPPVGRIPKPLTVSRGSPDRKLRVAYQGVRGNYSETAAGKAFPECETVACEHPEDAFQSVELSIADRAVLPVENTTGGSIHRTYDLLLRHRLHIVGELQLSFRHCLLALPGVRTEHINRVISHPQALAQCEHTLTNLRFNVRREAVDDTAGAAKFVRQHNLRDTAVIASAHAAEIYNLNIIADGINDDSNNITRFITLAREPIIPTTDRPFKTSIVFAEERGTSVLFKVLSAFAFRNINLMKIESRPNRNRPVSVVDDEVAGTLKRFEYMFYVDFEASMADVRAQNAMAEVEEYTSFLRVLGSYPMDITPWRE